MRHKSLILLTLFLCGIFVHAQSDTFVKPTSSYVSLAKGRAWGQASAARVLLRPPAPSGTITFTIVNNNPTSAHSTVPFDLKVCTNPYLTSGADGSCGYTNFLPPLNNNYGTIFKCQIGTSFTINPSETLVCTLSFINASWISITLPKSPTAAGTPDTFDLFSILTTNVITSYSIVGDAISSGVPTYQRPLRIDGYNAALNVTICPTQDSLTSGAWCKGIRTTGTQSFVPNVLTQLQATGNNFILTTFSCVNVTAAAATLTLQDGAGNVLVNAYSIPANSAWTNVINSPDGIKVNGLKWQAGSANALRCEYVSYWDNG